MTACPFCTLSAARIVDEGEHCIAIRDAYPVSEGHTLIISKRRVGSFFELVEWETLELFRLLARAKQTLDAAFSPAGFNVGINDRRAAGKSVPHLLYT